MTWTVQWRKEGKGKQPGSQEISALPTVHCTQCKCLCRPPWALHIAQATHPSIYPQLGRKEIVVIQRLWIPHGLTVTLVIGSLEIHDGYFNLQTCIYPLHLSTIHPSTNTFFRHQKLRRAGWFHDKRFAIYKLILIWLVSIIPSLDFSNTKYHKPLATFPLSNSLLSMRFRILTFLKNPHISQLIAKCVL